VPWCEDDDGRVVELLPSSSPSQPGMPSMSAAVPTSTSATARLARRTCPSPFSIEAADDARTDTAGKLQTTGILRTPGVMMCRRMRHLPRQILAVLAVVSLTMCVAACAAWVRSYSVGTEWSWKRSHENPGKFVRDNAAVVVGEGGAFVLVSHYELAGAEAAVHQFVNVLEEPVDRGMPTTPKARRLLLPHDSWHDFHFSTERQGGQYGPVAETSIITRAAAPFWAVALLLTVLPAIWFLQFTQRSRRARRGDCPNCGYDRRAHTRGDRCPECGTAVAVPRPS
jgi:hypothetical protein